MNAFGFAASSFRGFDFDSHVRVAQNQVHLGAACGSPKRDRKVGTAVMPVRPALLKNEMFKGAAILNSSGRKGFMV